MPFTIASAEDLGALRGLGFVRGDIRLLLRLEGLGVLLLACAAYAVSGASWLLFALLFLMPDITFVFYLAGRAAGTLAYNTAHTYLPPLAMLTASLLAYPELKPYALIWIAHIGFDRFVGYGLKYGSAFGHTHLGLVGKA